MDPFYGSSAMEKALTSTRKVWSLVAMCVQVRSRPFKNVHRDALSVAEQLAILSTQKNRTSRLINGSMTTRMLETHTHANMHHKDETHTHANMRRCMHAHAPHTHTHKSTHTHTTHTHTYIYIYTHKHTEKHQLTQCKQDQTRTWTVG